MKIVLRERSGMLRILLEEGDAGERVCVGFPLQHVLGDARDTRLLLPL